MKAALTLCLFAVILTGCGSGIQTPATVTQNPATVRPDRSGSWMAPEAKGEDLLYVAENCGGVCIAAYPSGKLVGSLSTWPSSLCSDKEGNVFLPVWNGTNAGYVYEYAHGFTKPKRTLTDPGFPYGCSVDPVTGNLAVANWSSDQPSQPGNVAIFQNAQGTPTLYSDPQLVNPSSAAYDNDGNLFVMGYIFDEPDVFAELPSGGSQLENIAINQYFYDSPGIQWDGQYLAVAAQQSISRVSVTGSNGTVVGTTVLRLDPHFQGVAGLFLIHKGVLITPFNNGSNSRVGFWNYPAGGKPVKVLKRYEGSAVTISVAPHR